MLRPGKSESEIVGVMTGDGTTPTDPFTASDKTNPLAWYRSQRHGIGTITPSGNVVVERITTAILADFPTVSGHYSRVEVVGATDAYQDDYDWPGMMRAAELLGHAEPGVICWNGSKGGSIGFDRDRILCRRITEATGRPATTSTLAIESVFRTTGVLRFGMVTPFSDSYANRIPPHFTQEGFTCVAGANAGYNDNLSYCRVPDADIASMIRTVASHRPDAIILYCTNFPGAPVVAAMEAETGIPIYDSTSVCVWQCLRLLGQETSAGARWGSLFSDPRLS
jgi:maleate isomerase